MITRFYFNKYTHTSSPPPQSPLITTTNHHCPTPHSLSTIHHRPTRPTPLPSASHSHPPPTTTTASGSLTLWLFAHRSVLHTHIHHCFSYLPPSCVSPSIMFLALPSRRRHGCRRPHCTTTRLCRPVSAPLSLSLHQTP